MEAEISIRDLILILDDKDLFIKECDGKDLITEAKDVFKACIDTNFDKLGFNFPCSPTPRTNFKVYELDEDLNFEKMFKTISQDLDKLSLSPAQIVNFCRQFRSSLPSKHHAILFLTKHHGHYFVISSDVFSSGYGAEIQFLHQQDFLMADDLYYIVVAA